MLACWPMEQEASPCKWDFNTSLIVHKHSWCFFRPEGQDLLDLILPSKGRDFWGIFWLLSSPVFFPPCYLTFFFTVSICGLSQLSPAAPHSPAVPSLRLLGLLWDSVDDTSLKLVSSFHRQASKRQNLAFDGMKCLW